MKVEIELDLPDGWDVVGYREPVEGEYYLVHNTVEQADEDQIGKAFILRKARWRAELFSAYYQVLMSDSSDAEVAKYVEENRGFDENAWNFGNYFKTKEEAQKVCDAVNALFEGGKVCP